MQGLTTASDSAPLGTAILLDEEGFLIEGGLWTEDLARQLAVAAGLGGLDAGQFAIIDVLRECYASLGASPQMRQVCRRLGLDRDAVKQAFGSCRALWQIAGLPYPGEEAISYLD